MYNFSFSVPQNREGDDEIWPMISHIIGYVKARDSFDFSFSISVDKFSLS